MKIENLEVDTKAIATGLYDIIVEKGEEAIVAFGMLPKWIIDLLEKEASEKLIRVTADFYKLSADEFRPYVDKAKLKELVGQIVHQCSLDIYAVAKERGALLV